MGTDSASFTSSFSAKYSVGVVALVLFFAKACNELKEVSAPVKPIKAGSVVACNNQNLSFEEVAAQSCWQQPFLEVK